LILERDPAVYTASGLISTVAVLAKAEEKGLISDLNSALQELRQVGFYFPVN
jgi:predicted nucleic acid-binding protein